MAAMRLLWALPRAMPALLRHLAGYAELATQDFELVTKDFGARLVAGAVFGVCLFFVICLCCLLVVALTWDTPYRVSAIGWMIGVFVAVAAAAGVYRAKVASAQSPMFASVRREWQADRVVADHIMAHSK